ncbi:MAG: hypothetical protein KY467_00240 [Gemmatimonadetes bacterium]|nr:hypothetical protein [Gemmatimonadota bacterium]
MIRLITVIGLAAIIAASGACGARPEVQAPASAATVSSDSSCCDVAVHDTVTLSKQDRCIFDAYRRRCQTGVERSQDLCILRCLANGQPNIGGGCWHACFAYRNVQWTVPAGVKLCESLRRRDKSGETSDQEGRE